MNTPNLKAVCFIFLSLTISNSTFAREPTRADRQIQSLTMQTKPVLQPQILDPVTQLKAHPSVCSVTLTWKNPKNQGSNIVMVRVTDAAIPMGASPETLDLRELTEKNATSIVLNGPIYCDAYLRFSVWHESIAGPVSNQKSTNSNVLGAWVTLVL